MTQTTIRPDLRAPTHVRDPWRVTKRTAALAASVWTQPLGIELRVLDEDGELLYSTTFRDTGELLAQADEWRAGKLSRGWTKAADDV